MSEPEEIKIECPNCRKRQKVIVWRAINATLDPELKKELLCGRINFFRCEKCGIEGYMPIDLLYHDMEREFVVQYIPFEWLNQNEVLDEFTEKGYIDIERDLTIWLGGIESLKDKFWSMVPDDHHFKRIHPVFDMNELIHYVIFRDRLFEQRQSGKNRDNL